MNKKTTTLKDLNDFAKENRLSEDVGLFVFGGSRILAVTCISTEMPSEDALYTDIYFNVEEPNSHYCALADDDGWIPVDTGYLPQPQDSNNTIIKYYIAQGKHGIPYRAFVNENHEWINEHGNKIRNVEAWREFPKEYKPQSSKAER